MTAPYEAPGGGSYRGEAPSGLFGRPFEVSWASLGALLGTPCAVGKPCVCVCVCVNNRPCGVSDPE